MPFAIKEVDSKSRIKIVNKEKRVKIGKHGRKYRKILQNKIHKLVQLSW